MKHTCGIYKITNTKTGDCYYGQSVDIEGRIKQHFNSNFRKAHPCKLYKAMKRYGVKNFDWEIIKECHPTALKINLQTVLAGNKAKYNVSKGNKSNRGYRETSLDSVARFVDVSRFKLTHDLVEKGLYTPGNMYHRKPVAKVSLKTGKVIKKFTSVLTAEKTMSSAKSSNHISEVCRGLRTSAYGYGWKFI